MSRAHSMRERERAPYAVMCKQGNCFFFFPISNEYTLHKREINKTKNVYKDLKASSKPYKHKI